MDSYENYGISIPNNKTTGEVVTTCPKCSTGRKPKNQKVKCLGVNLDKKVFRCNHCEWAGALRPEKEEVKVYTKPSWKNKTALSEKVVKYFESRGISQKTLVDFKITEGLEWMPQTEREENTIQFNYFKNEELVNVKYRTGAKHFKLFKGAEKIFYNFDAILSSQDVYLVEGEIDALSMHESGYNAISVPNGANDNLDYLDSCIDLFNGKNIHLAFDNDIKGRQLKDFIAERFGKERCDYIVFKDCKDANECLVKYGKRGIKECIESPVQFPLEGAFTISDFDSEIEDMYVNGLDKGVDLRIDSFDLRIVKGYITIVTGIPSHGKSDWVDYMALKLKLEHNWKGAFYSPENKPIQLHFSKLARKLIGKHWDGINRITDEEKNLVKRFLNESFYFLKPEKDFTLASILSSVRQLQKQKGLDFLVIDAWNKLEHKGKQDTDYIGKSLDELAAFCELNNIHLILVAHPTKIGKDENGKYKVPTLYDIAGSSNFYNKADNGICVYRDFEKGITTIHRQKIKFDHWGVEGFSDYKYDLQSKRYNEASRINFDIDNWISKKIQIAELDAPMTKIKPNISWTETDKPYEDDSYQF